ncbi:hypothetical protein SDC9_205153 [bioreactor metagenome]|uniref:Uncharacterized protein n=1 Tax=bioreactor metagenome TaxID=1076179 RepID=A0A645J441_9ZZZZ
MSIRTIDFQTIIPKSPEIQKIKNAENETQRNNLNIDIHKNQEQSDKKLKQVNGSQESYKTRIKDENDKEKGKNQSNYKREENKNSKHDLDKQDKEKNIKLHARNSIDIRI